MKNRQQHIEHLEKDYPICLQPIIEKMEEDFHARLNRILDLFNKDKKDLNNDIIIIKQELHSSTKSLLDKIDELNGRLKEDDKDIDSEIINELKNEIKKINDDYEDVFNQLESVDSRISQTNTSINQLSIEINNKFESIENKIDNIESLTNNENSIPYIYVKQSLTDEEVKKNKAVIDSMSFYTNYIREGVVCYEDGKEFLAKFVKLSSYGGMLNILGYLMPTNTSTGTETNPVQKSYYSCALNLDGTLKQNVITSYLY